MIPMGVCVCYINASPTLKVIVVVGACRDAACLEKHGRMIERCKGYSCCSRTFMAMAM
jgi:hypothetical protein